MKTTSAVRNGDDVEVRDCCRKFITLKYAISQKSTLLSRVLWSARRLICLSEFRWFLRKLIEKAKILLSASVISQSKVAGYTPQYFLYLQSAEHKKLTEAFCSETKTIEPQKVFIFRDFEGGSKLDTFKNTFNSSTRSDWASITTSSMSKLIHRRKKAYRLLLDLTRKAPFCWIFHFFIQVKM